MLRVLAAIAILTTLLFVGCGKKPDAPSPLPSGTAILEPGRGAVLVQFDRSKNVPPEDWLALVHLQSELDARALRRMPLADLQAMIVLDVEPGVYRVVAQAWRRKFPPSSGGTLDSVRVTAGHLTILTAPPLYGEFTAEPQARLTQKGRTIWTLRSESELPEFVAEALRRSEKG